jgi:AmiR/NasT family two-component response regulator
MNDEAHFRQLSDDVQRVLATALNKYEAEMERRDVRHIAESERRDQLHISELERRDQLHVDEMALIAAAIESRDTIGQAKGVIMVTMGCTADDAFQLLKAQSQHENRKLVDVAAEIAQRASGKHRAD